MQYSPSIEKFHQRVERPKWGRGPRFYAIDPLYESCPWHSSETKSSSNSSRRVAKEREGSIVGYARSIPSTGRVSMSKKKKEKVYVAEKIDVSRCHDEKCYCASY